MINFLIKNLFIFSIKIYSNFISVFLPDACRFTPSCSNYAQESIKKHTTPVAIGLIVKRLSKCHPFHNNTGYDPVP
tara:strand:+ start:228 stop:455 length:228 start_codon:yes stop_codon:yes gene_type:complete